MATNNRLIEELANELRRRRLSLLKDIAGSQRAARAPIEERGSEIEENAQKDRIGSLVSYLNGRDQKMIQQIDATLKRIDEGTYGQCDWCEDEIGWETYSGATYCNSLHRLRNCARKTAARHFDQSKL